MKLLLDTHALIWWELGEDRLSSFARNVIADESNEVLVSAVSAMEISTKFRLGKLPNVGRLAQDFEAVIDEQGFHPLSISVRHARLAGSLQSGHKDPFDRLLIAQALVEDVPLATNEAHFDQFGVTRVW